ncbi:MAG: N-acetyltransferase family protein [Ancrocorticia sp.]
MHIRHATFDDLEAILEIYNDAVINTVAIWNEQTVDLQDRREWLIQHQDYGYPVLVGVDDNDDVLGYATFGDWRPWEGYRHSVEHSVYVRSDRRGGGIGKRLMRELIDCARTTGKHVMVAGIEASNEGSIRLHKKLGFQEIGTLREVGSKFGRWLDLTFMQLILDDAANPGD